MAGKMKRANLAHAERIISRVFGTGKFRRNVGGGGGWRVDPDSAGVGVKGIDVCIWFCAKQ